MSLLEIDGLGGMIDLRRDLVHSRQRMHDDRVCFHPPYEASIYLVTSLELFIFFLACKAFFLYTCLVHDIDFADDRAQALRLFILDCVFCQILFYITPDFEGFRRDEIYFYAIVFSQEIRQRTDG